MPPVVAIWPCGVDALGMPALFPDVVSVPSVVALLEGTPCANDGKAKARNPAAMMKHFMVKLSCGET